MKAAKSKITNSKFIAVKPLIVRTVFFLFIFVIYSGLIGPRIISGGILYKDHFGFYGGLGKAFLFAALAFGLLFYRRDNQVKLKSWNWLNLMWIILSVISFFFAWILVSNLLRGNNSLINTIGAQVLLWFSLALAFLGVFGISNVKKVFSTYKKELLYSAILAILFYGLLAIVYSLWEVLASIVLHSVKWLLGLSGLHSIIIQPRILLLDKFGINIAQYCSGIESIALFSGLYILTGVLDWNKFNHRRFLYTFPVALFILFGLNIIRVYVLILAGYYINPQIAFSLFHTYAGMLFFIAYSLVFWAVSYKFMLAKEDV